MTNDKPQKFKPIEVAALIIMALIVIDIYACALMVKKPVYPLKPRVGQYNNLVNDSTFINHEK